MNRIPKELLKVLKSGSKNIIRCNLRQRVYIPIYVGCVIPAKIVTIKDVIEPTKEAKEKFGIAENGFITVYRHVTHGFEPTILGDTKTNDNSIQFEELPIESIVGGRLVEESVATDEPMGRYVFVGEDVFFSVDSALNAPAYGGSRMMKSIGVRALKRWRKNKVDFINETKRNAGLKEDAVAPTRKKPVYFKL